MKDHLIHVVPGQIYKHYKGGLYEVLHLAKHTETGEIMVVYRSTQFGTYYTRPLEIWNTPVNNNPRFWPYNN